jgi:hypothetical protein
MGTLWGFWLVLQSIPSSPPDWDDFLQFNIPTIKTIGEETSSITPSPITKTLPGKLPCPVRPSTKSDIASHPIAREAQMNVTAMNPREIRLAETDFTKPPSPET